MTAPVDKDPGGRPTKYNTSFEDIASKYLEETKDKPKEFPTIEGLAEILGVDDETVTIWANARVKDAQGNKTREKKHPVFSATIKRIKSCQKKRLMLDGLYGGKEVNAVMAIFLLKNNHGMVEQINTDLTTKGKEMPTPIYGSKSTE